VIGCSLAGQEDPERPDISLCNPAQQHPDSFQEKAYLITRERAANSG
jgi:hypothetical protein